MTSGCLSRMRRNSHVRFLGEGHAARRVPYPTSYEGSIPFTRSTSASLHLHRTLFAPVPGAVRLRAALHAGLLALLLILAAPAAQAATPEQLFATLRPSVVKVFVREYVVEGADEPGVTIVQSEGSGVLFSADGKVLTVSHLVQTADEIAVEFDDGQRTAARVYASEPAADVALLQVEALPQGKQPVVLGNSDHVRVGQRVVVIGAPFGLAGMISVGNVSGRQRPRTPFGELEQLEMFVIDAHVERGSSGGGVFDLEGRLIGVVTSVQFGNGRSRGLGFAVTASTVQSMLVQRRSLWTGIGCYWLTGTLAHALNLPQPAGLLVQRVARNSPAAQLTLRGGTSVATVGEARFIVGGDIILEAQGVTLLGHKDYARMQQALARVGNGDTLRLTVLRGGQQIKLEAPIHR